MSQHSDVEAEVHVQCHSQHAADHKEGRPTMGPECPRGLPAPHPSTWLEGLRAGPR